MDCGENPCSSWKNCSQWEGYTLEQFVKDCMPWEGNHTAAGEKREEKGAAETNFYELGCNPSSPSPCTSWDEGGRRVRSEVESGRKEEGRGKYFLVFVSHYPILLLIGNKLD